MSEQDPGSIQFLSWVRRGAATRIQGPPVSPATVEARITFNSSAQETGGVDLTLLGPGDVIGFDSRAVLRAWPPPETRDAEPNYFPIVEFDQVDLPWRYTPHAPDGTQRLRPWFCLLVVKDDPESEIESYEPARRNRALAKVKIKAGTPMPRIGQAYAWAHVQVSGEGDPAQTVSSHPERCLARLMCPRRLDERTTYWAMLVPTFEAGRRAGLRLEPAGDPLDEAWQVDSEGLLSDQAHPDGLELPVYHRWRFATGGGGDFEELVRELRPRPLPAEVGTRDLDVSEPGAGLPAASTVPLRLEAALRAPSTEVPPWQPAEKVPFVNALSALLNIPAEVRATGGTSSVVTPPLYGTWHAKNERLQGGTNPPWFRQLNQDPRHRVVAALGTEVVQNQQQELMASAWQQLDGIRETNDRLRKAQFARVVSERLYGRFVEPGNADTVLTLAAPALGHTLHGPKTIRWLAKNSPTRLALLGSAFRRLSRPLGPIGRRQGKPDSEPAPIVTRVNDGEYDDVLAESPPLLEPGDLAMHAWIGTQHVTWTGPMTEAEVQAEPPRAHVVVWDPEYPNPPADDQSPNSSVDSPSMGRFRAAAEEFANRESTPSAAPTLTRLDLPAVRASVVAALDPRTTIPAGLRGRLGVADGFDWNPADPLEPVLAHPEFPQPMYKPLADVSQEWVLPGLSEVPANTVTLAVTNQAFVEAYMIGLNHEMARELLWNEYPTDQRGNYFRQFWDVAGVEREDEHVYEDVAPIQAWKTSSLGTNSPRTSESQLVLLVRGEVFRRYPGTLVYAQRAEGTVEEPTLGDPQSQVRPVFAGRLRPDVVFFGFPLTVAEARGTTQDPGWFFVFEEQPGEPRFGLDVDAEDPPQSWDDLAWVHLVDDPEDLASLHYIDLSQPLPATNTITNHGNAGWHESAGGGAPIARGADHAFITFQRPVRVAIHASEMLP